VRPRQIAVVALVLGLSVAGFFVALLLGQRDARRDSEHGAEVAAAQIRLRVEQGSSLAESLRRFMVGVAGAGVTSDEFQSNSSKWLSPAGFPAAAWVEEVPATRRGSYERRIGHPIVTQDGQGTLEPAPSRSSYLPATLVSGIPPMSVPAIDFGGDPGVAAAGESYEHPLWRGRNPLDDAARRLEGAVPDRVRSASHQRGGHTRIRGGVRIGTGACARRRPSPRPCSSRSAAPPPEIVSAPAPCAGRSRRRDSDSTSRCRCAPSRARRRCCLGSSSPGASCSPLSRAPSEVNAARRARAQDEVDRIFNLSPDLIAVADFDGHFTRVNPAAEQVLGYTKEELLARPYLDFVHPDDRERTAAEAASIGQGDPTLSFENRFASKDGSYRVLEWMSTPVVEERVMYGMARDVTERRHAEAERGRLAGEQAALRRVATLVARGVPAAEVFSAVADEVGRLLDAQATSIGRLEPDGTMVVVAANGTASDVMPVGSRLKLEPSMVLAEVVETGRSARTDDLRPRFRRRRPDGAPAGIRSAVAVPIVVEGSLWGSIAVGTERERFPADAEQRMSEFTELAGRRSQMRRAGPSSPRPARASSPPQTGLARKSSGTCTTVRSSASSTP